MVKRIRVLVVEDSLSVRKHLVEVLEAHPEIEVVGEASDGRRAIELCSSLRPDLMTLDLVLPVIDGLEVTEHVMAYCPTPILIVSAATNRADLFHTYDALAAGAVDVFDKPSAREDASDWPRRFVAAVRIASRVRVITHPRARLRPSMRAGAASANERPRGRPLRAVVIGASTGGPGAVLTLLQGLRPDFPLPILVVIHIGETFGGSLAAWLDEMVPFPVREARGGEALPEPGGCTVVLAPPGRHLLLRDGRLRLTEDEERHSCRPSVDVLFESAARELGPAVVGCLLTGMGRDGALGLRAIAQSGGETFAQDEQTCVVFGMPGEAVRIGAAKQVLPLTRIAGALTELARVHSRGDDCS